MTTWPVLQIDICHTYIASASLVFYFLHSLSPVLLVPVLIQLPTLFLNAKKEETTSIKIVIYYPKKTGACTSCKMLIYFYSSLGIMHMLNHVCILHNPTQRTTLAGKGSRRQFHLHLGPNLTLVSELSKNNRVGFLNCPFNKVGTLRAMVK